MNIPNLLTVLRVLLIPIIILLFYLPFAWSYLAASAVFTIAAVTDWLDGYLARRLEQGTPFGAFLDPVADKLMVAVALVLLVEEHANLWLTLPAAIIIGREIVVSALREWMAELGARAQVAVSNLGKWKCGNSSVGRARPCQGRGREFESRFPLQSGLEAALPACTQSPFVRVA